MFQQGKEEESGSFLKKRTKKLLLTAGVGENDAKARSKQKFFWFFFFKKRTAYFALPLLALFIADRVFPPDLQRYQKLSLEVDGRDGTALDVLTAADGDYRLPAGDVSPNYIKLLVATEDKRFWWDPGVDPLAMGRAVAQLVARGHVVSGGSTLTMQVARLLTPHRHDVAGKLLDMARAVQLTAHFSKRQILAMYLTLAPYGGNLEGVRAGAQAYFQTGPGALTDTQAALLVALPRSPEALRPDRHKAAALAAARLVLARAGMADVFDADDFAGLTRHKMPMFSPHLAMRLRGEGLRGVVRTTLDAGLQENLVTLATREAGFLDPNANMAALVVDNHSRNILAYLGGDDFFGRRGMVDMVRARRSPGSTLKPFIYGMAMDESLIVPGTLIADAPMDLGGYAPRDFDGGFAGMVTARVALQQSYNLPAVQLLRAVGAKRFVAALRAAGARLVLPGDAAASLPVALGGVGINLEDLAMLYAGLADGGQVAPLAVLPGAAPKTVPLMTAASAAQIGGILRGSPLPDGVAATDRAIAYKTGTSYGFRDAWAAGFSGDYTVVVWVGRVDGTPSPGAYGRATAAPLLFRIFSLLPPDVSAPPEAPEAQAAGLRTFGAPRIATARPGPKILFPPDGAILQVTGDAAPVSLEAAGGAPPYRWVVNGTMLPPSPIGVAMSWQPSGPGFAHIAVIDKNENATSEDIQMH
jgi:penicillin-binding protein 1C